VSLLRSIMGSPKMSIAGLGISADRCPIYRSIHSAIDIMTAYELLPTDVLGRQVIEAAKTLAIERSRSPLNSSADC
jgi:hypothetical protein